MLPLAAPKVTMNLSPRRSVPLTPTLPLVTHRNASEVWPTAKTSGAMLSSGWTLIRSPAADSVAASSSAIPTTVDMRNFWCIPIKPPGP